MYSSEARHKGLPVPPPSFSSHPEELSEAHLRVGGISAAGPCELDLGCWRELGSPPMDGVQAALPYSFSLVSHILSSSAMWLHPAPRQSWLPSSISPACDSGPHEKHWCLSLPACGLISRYCPSVLTILSMQPALL
jgi:hypothetical protein